MKSQFEKDYELFRGAFIWSFVPSPVKTVLLLILVIVAINFLWIASRLCNTTVFGLVWDVIGPICKDFLKIAVDMCHIFWMVILSIFDGTF